MTQLNNGTKEMPQSHPWYCYGWPWFLISFPLASVILGVVMIYLALQTNNSLVVDDYYKQGKAINVRLERDQQASLRGISASLLPDAEGLILQLSSTFPQAANSTAWPDMLDVRWVHVTQAERDRQAEFRALGGQRYLAPDIKHPDDGHYRIHIQPAGNPSWRLVSEPQTLNDTDTVKIASKPMDRVFPQDAL